MEILWTFNGCYYDYNNTPIKFTFNAQLGIGIDEIFECAISQYNFNDKILNNNFELLSDSIIYNVIIASEYNSGVVIPYQLNDKIVNINCEQFTKTSNYKSIKLMSGMHLFYTTFNIYGK